MNKRVLITGVTGQDGSYLAELALSEGDMVYGMARRGSATPQSHWRIAHLMEYGGFRLLHGDITDPHSLHRVIDESAPDEIYNLCAMSYVGDSFREPSHTWDVTAGGLINLLEVVRTFPVNNERAAPRIFQASTSEMYGSAYSVRDSVRHTKYGNREILTREYYQDENTPFRPNSPYAVAKLAAHHACRVYRDSYGMFISCGITFNHECVAARTPLVVRRGGVISVVTPDDLITVHRKVVQSFPQEGVDIWDGREWTSLRCVTVTKRRPYDADHKMVTIHGRAGVVETTSHHKMIADNGQEMRADEVVAGQNLLLAESLPASEGWAIATPEMAEFLGLIASDGYVGDHQVRFTNKDLTLLERAEELWKRLFLGKTRRASGLSGFCDDEIPRAELFGVGQDVCRCLRKQLYTKSGLKKVPDIILNGNQEVQDAFLKGHYDGDGLKATTATSVVTNSEVLAAGLLLLYGRKGFDCCVYLNRQSNRTDAYYINVRKGGNSGAHLRKPLPEVRKVTEARDLNEWVFDLETGSGRFMAGVGKVVVHNSPRRGEEFVTRKITSHVAKVVTGKSKGPLELGNMKATRDWGYAGDYVKAMRLMLSRDKPGDWVIATGEDHSVEEFARLAFAEGGIDFEGGIISTPSLYRPCEVPRLKGEPSKAMRELGWAPTVTFHELVKMMVHSDIELESQGA